MCAANLSRHLGDIKRIASRFPRLMRLPNRLLDFIEDRALLGLSSEFDKAFQGDQSTNVVVSLTSFPARIEHAWIPIESIFRQSQSPWKVVLVLAEEEFPNRALPEKICLQKERGLEILWVERNMRSYKKLLPTLEKYPDANIVTIDDDIIYEPWLLSQLLDAAKERPRTLIGHRGWVVTGDTSGLRPYVEWPSAGPHTTTDRVFLTSGAGVLYPPNSMPIDLISDIDLAMELCPSADDIWFWIIARKSGVPAYCLGNHKIRTIRRLKGVPELFMTNRFGGQNDVQLKTVLDYFGLWESLSFGN